MDRKKIAIIGTGISGLTAAYLIHKDHDITVFEANNYIGGHTNTIEVETFGNSYSIDTGFIVFNERTYPNFIKLMKELGVDSQASDMAFSVSNEISGLEYSSSTLSSFFGQRKNLIKPSFYKMIFEILRFNSEAPSFLEANDDSITLGKYLEMGNYSSMFINNFIVPLGSAIWSTVSDKMMAFPALTFIRFCKNHGMLSISDAPQWRVIKGGSNQYIKCLIDGFKDKILLNTPVKSISRKNNKVQILSSSKNQYEFDKVIIASHSDQALKMLSDPSNDEMEILKSIPYEVNIATLHTDSSILPKIKKTWGSWNYHVWDRDSRKVSLTYYMNKLQNIKSEQDFCVTLNDSGKINPEKIIKIIKYHHPQFGVESIRAQKKKHLINGVQNTYFCGAYWGYGFHEDGVNSSLDVASQFGKSL